MGCNTYRKSSLNAFSTSSQTLETNDIVTFSNNSTDTGCSICHAAGTGSIRLNEGLYLVQFNGTLTTPTAGTATVQLLNNGVVVQGATASQTTAAATDVITLSFSTVVQVLKSCCCINNIANLTVQNTGVGTIFTNANIDVVRLA